VDVPAVVLAIVLAETAVGGLALTWLAPTWGAVRHGYEILLGSTLAAMAWGAWAALRTPLEVVSDGASDTVVRSAGLVETGLLVTTVLAALAVVVLVAKLPPVLARVLGVASTAVGLATFLPLAQLRTETAEGGLAVGLAELVLGAFLLGAIWDGMVLGHWYLVERRLSNRYMIWIAWVNVAAVVAGVIAVGLSALHPAPASIFFSPILSIGSMTIVLGLGVLALVALIAGFNVKLANEGGRSIQASTGMFYLAVILAPAAEFAAKVRFF
jgi:hypothetical protein